MNDPAFRGIKSIAVAQMMKPQLVSMPEVKPTALNLLRMIKTEIYGRFEKIINVARSYLGFTRSHFHLTDEL